MKHSSKKRTAIFFSLDSGKVETLFNPHDEAPMYERQLDESFAQYLCNSAGLYGKHARVQYRVRCKEEDQSMVDPFMYAVRRYFRAREASRKNDYKSFRKKASRFILAGLVLVLASQGLHLLTSFLGDAAFYLVNAVSVFSWVMFFKGTEIWIFKKRPILKEISLYHRLALAEAVVVREKDIQENLNYERAA